MSLATYILTVGREKLRALHQEMRTEQCFSIKVFLQPGLQLAAVQDHASSCKCTVPAISTAIRLKGTNVTLLSK